MELCKRKKGVFPEKKNQFKGLEREMGIWKKGLQRYDLFIVKMPYGRNMRVKGKALTSILGYVSPCHTIRYSRRW